jgi:hypothetical protein
VYGKGSKDVRLFEGISDNFFDNSVLVKEEEESVESDTIMPPLRLPGRKKGIRESGSPDGLDDEEDGMMDQITTLINSRSKRVYKEDNYDDRVHSLITTSTKYVNNIEEEDVKQEGIEEYLLDTGSTATIASSKEGFHNILVLKKIGTSWDWSSDQSDE